MEIEEFYIQHDPVRVIIIHPIVNKVLSNGTEIISYYWEGAEIAVVPEPCSR